MRTGPFILAGGVFLLDQASKSLVRAALRPAESLEVIPGVFSITLILNPGAAFGLFPWLGFVLLVVGLAAAAALLWYLWWHRPEPPLLRYGLALALGGVAGNLVDRATLGRVVDFLDFRIWPAFNIADTAIVTGVALISYELLGLSSRGRTTNSSSSPASRGR